MCHKKITIFACNCVLRNHRLCPHSQNLVAVTPDNMMQGNSQSNPQDNMPVPDHINQPDNANTASEGHSTKDDVNTASQNTSAAPTITLEVSTPPPSPDGTATPLNAGASPFAPTSSPFAPMSSPLAPPSSVGATIGSSTIRSPLSVDTPSASIPNSPSATLFFTPTRSTGPSTGPFATGPSMSTDHPSFGTIFTPIAPTSNLSLPFFGHSASTSASAGSNMNQNIAEGYPFPSPTNGTLTPSTWMFTHLSYARQQTLNPNPQDLIKSTLSETRSPATRSPLQSGFYPRHFDSAQRHIHWNDVKTEWVDCAGFYCTHFRDLPNMTPEKKEQEHQDCPESFGDADKVVSVQLGLCKECEGFHYEAASRGEGGSNTVEWGRAMVVANGFRMGHTHQSQNQPGPEMHVGGQHHNEGHTHTHSHTHNQLSTATSGQQQHEDDADGQTTPTVEARQSMVERMLPRDRVRMVQGQTHQSHNQQPETSGQHQQQRDEDDGQTTLSVEQARYIDNIVADRMRLIRQRHDERRAAQTHQSHNQQQTGMGGQQDHNNDGHSVEARSSYIERFFARHGNRVSMGHTQTHNQNQPEMLVSEQQQQQYEEDDDDDDDGDSIHTVLFGEDHEDDEYMTPQESRGTYVERYFAGLTHNQPEMMRGQQQQQPEYQPEDDEYITPQELRGTYVDRYFAGLTHNQPEMMMRGQQQQQPEQPEQPEDDDDDDEDDGQTTPTVESRYSYVDRFFRRHGLPTH